LHRPPFSLFGLRDSDTNYSRFYFLHPASLPIYTLSLHDALPIFPGRIISRVEDETERNREEMAKKIGFEAYGVTDHMPDPVASKDRKSTRLNSSHVKNSYAVFCLKKKTKSHTFQY